MKRYETIYIDIPSESSLGSEEEGWTNVHTLKNATKEEAVEWIRENIGHCDDDGKIDLITLG